MELDGATVLLQWATGGLACCWVVTRHGRVGVGFGWLLRATYLVIALGALAVGRLFLANGSASAVRDLGTAGVVLGAAVALVVSVNRRRLGPGGFPAALDLVAPVCGLVGLTAAAVDVGGPEALAFVRLVAGAVFLGSVTDAMLLGHWYLVQPELGRGPILDVLRLTAIAWVPEVAALCWPIGMGQVFTGTVDDGWSGVLGLIWVTAGVTTLGLLGLTWLALRERYYSAVMAATGLLYLAILTAFGTDLIARAVLNP